MSSVKGDAIERLKSFNGKIVHAVHTEVWVREASSTDDIVSVQVEMTDGPSFVLGCSSRGGVFVRESRLEAFPGDTELRELSAVGGSILSAFSISGDEAIIKTSSASLVIRNCGDELCVKVEGAADASCAHDRK